MSFDNKQKDTRENLFLNIQDSAKKDCKQRDHPKKDILWVWHKRDLIWPLNTFNIIFISWAILIVIMLAFIESFIKICLKNNVLVIL